LAPTERSLQVYDTAGKPSESIAWPAIFSYPFRPDIIQKAVIAVQSKRYQPKGRDPMAGKRNTAQFVGVGRDLSRVPRIKGDRYPRAGQAAFAPTTVKGRLTHPPSPEKRLAKHINSKERLLALQSAIAATSSKDLVAARGHKVEKIPSIPLIVSDELEKLRTTSEAKSALAELGLADDLTRAKKGVRIRAGRGRARGRRTKHPRGPLIVVSRDQGVGKAVRNLTGVNVVQASSLNVEDLAPGTHAGRLTIWTKSAIESVEKRFAK
jgi:large subunit ribosomal protein L4e